MRKVLIFLLPGILMTGLSLAQMTELPPLQHPRLRQQQAEVQQDVEGEARIPSKWYRGARGYDKALEDQKLTGADIFIWFSRPNTPDEKGLCKWFNDKGIKSLPVRRLLREYHKVEVNLPGNPKNQDLAENFRFRKTPSVYVVRTDGWKNRIKVFEWENKRPKLLEPSELANLIRLNSSDKYQLPAEEVTRDQ